MTKQYRTADHSGQVDRLTGEEARRQYNTFLKQANWGQSPLTKGASADYCRATLKNLLRSMERPDRAP